MNQVGREHDVIYMWLYVATITSCECSMWLNCQQFTNVPFRVTSQVHAGGVCIECSYLFTATHAPFLQQAKMVYRASASPAPQPALGLSRWPPELLTLYWNCLLHPPPHTQLGFIQELNWGGGCDLCFLEKKIRGMTRSPLKIDCYILWDWL